MVNQLLIEEEEEDIFAKIWCAQGVKWGAQGMKLCEIAAQGVKLCAQGVKWCAQSVDQGFIMVCTCEQNAADYMRVIMIYRRVLFYTFHDNFKL